MSDAYKAELAAKKQVIPNKITKNWKTESSTSREVTAEDLGATSTDKELELDK